MIVRQITHGDVVMAYLPKAEYYDRYRIGEVNRIVPKSRWTSSWATITIDFKIPVISVGTYKYIDMPEPEKYLRDDTYRYSLGGINVTQYEFSDNVELILGKKSILDILAKDNTEEGKYLFAKLCQWKKNSIETFFQEHLKREREKKEKLRYLECKKKLKETSRLERRRSGNCSFLDGDEAADLSYQVEVGSNSTFEWGIPD